MNIKAYLKRIHYHGAVEPTPETLRSLQVAHLRSVPFENLSIHASESIVLEDDALFTKIVEKNRGGFCYEANGLFAALLRALGFEVTMLSAQVANAEGEFGPDFAHMTLMVIPGGPADLARRWLVDVGFGDSFLEPLLLDEREVQVQGNRAYRILAEGSRLVLSQRDEAGEWKSQYRFTLQPYEYPDYAEMCHYHQTSPDSHFTKSRICSRATEAGRITLSDLRFISTSTAEGRQVREEQSLTDDEYHRVLREQFGIVMTS